MEVIFLFPWTGSLQNEGFKFLCKQDDAIPWCCNHCILDALPFRNVTNSEFLKQHQFYSKKNLTFQLDLNELNELYLLTIVLIYLNVDDMDYNDFCDIFNFQKTRKILQQTCKHNPLLF